ncbi:MAG: DUF624 domain-containing protein [Lachnospiraceae bacterium]|nr:DUF624 domain-containing protein [Lachnospiraceae bacterium]
MKKKSGRNIWGFDGSFMSFCDKLFDLMILGFLWILCSLPLITVGASCTALYYAVVKCIKNHEGYVSRAFFHSFRQNLVPATILWVVFAGVSFLMQLNIGILSEKTSGYIGLFFIVLYVLVCIYAVITACYAFPALSRFDMPVGWILKISLYMGVRYFPTSLMLMVILACFGAFIWNVPLLILFVPGPAAFLMSEFLERILKKHMPAG